MAASSPFAPGAPPPEDLSVPAPETLAARRAGAAARKLLLGLIASRAPADELEAAADQLEAIAARLAPHSVRSRYDDPAGVTGAAGGIQGPRFLEHHLLLGASNPLAPPLSVDRGPDGSVLATVTYDLRYEGLPGLVHGGAIALAFDLVLGIAAGWVAQGPAMTGTLTARYRKPSELWTELVYEASAEPVGARTVRAFGTLSGPDGVSVEAEGIWVKTRSDDLGPVE